MEDISANTSKNKLEIAKEYVTEKSQQFLELANKCCSCLPCCKCCSCCNAVADDQFKDIKNNFEDEILEPGVCYHRPAEIYDPKFKKQDTNEQKSKKIEKYDVKCKTLEIYDPKFETIQHLTAQPYNASHQPLVCINPEMMEIVRNLRRQNNIIPVSPNRDFGIERSQYAISSQQTLYQIDVSSNLNLDARNGTASATGPSNERPIHNFSYNTPPNMEKDPVNTTNARRRSDQAEGNVDDNFVNDNAAANPSTDITELNFNDTNMIETLPTQETQGPPNSYEDRLFEGNVITDSGGASNTPSGEDSQHQEDNINHVGLPQDQLDVNKCCLCRLQAITSRFLPCGCFICCQACAQSYIKKNCPGCGCIVNSVHL